ncbi:methyltransferase domain-containing protein [Catellatospora sichuanensis]|uniref:methyltransferase domain-containing protein n=1 Tax=Catellatospora sichuanensis TaxID=1969805 RepID=UPI001181C96B|nr:methyltransferase domain-containing protein [Catellatospora sichuanensis]
MTDAPLMPHYARVDQSPPQMQARLVAYLDKAAAYRAITDIRTRASETMHVKPGHHVLDGGCGLGEEVLALALLVGADGRVDGVDNSRSMLSLAAHRYERWHQTHPDAGDVRFVTGDLARLDYPADVFDAVRCERTLQHLPQAEAVIAELIRVTRPQGRICLVDTDWESLVFDGLPAEVLTPMMWRLRHHSVMSNPTMGRTLRNRLRRAGVGELECHPMTMCFTDPAEAQHVVPYFDRDMLLHIVGEEDGDATATVDRWLDVVRDADEREDFLVALTVWVVAGTVPA